MVNTRYRPIFLSLLLVLSGCTDDESPAQAVAAPAPPANANASVDSAAAVADLVAAAAELSGQETYEHYCGDCHNAGHGHPGTMRLAVRIDPASSVLRERTDLTPEYVKIVVRNGLQMMPPFRPSEIADDELDALSRYVAAKYVAPSDADH